MKRVRERYNTKARQSCPGSLKNRKRPRHTSTASAETVDPNAEILVPISREQKEKERKERLVQEVSRKYRAVVYLSLVQLAAQSESKVSSKRRKRLEKYIVRHTSLLDTFLDVSLLGQKIQTRGENVDL